MKVAALFPPDRKQGSRWLRALVLPPLLALGLGACSTTGTGGTTGSIAPAEKPQSSTEMESSVTKWGQRYARNPKDKTAALNYASSLTRVGRTDQAVAVLQTATLNFPDNRDILAAYGKALAADGQLDRALQIIRRAQTPEQPDWRLLSAEAAILDQKGMTQDARRLYKQARDYAPNEPSIVSNLGMSYLLSGELKQAETLLREASAMTGADSRVRQNLGLAVGLQGRFDEAEAIVSAELPPDQAEANIAYLRSMIGQHSGKKRKAG